MGYGRYIIFISQYFFRVFRCPILFPIRDFIEKPDGKTQMEFNETEQELEIEEYLNDTYNLTKALNRRKENKNGISKTK